MSNNLSTIIGSIVSIIFNNKTNAYMVLLIVDEDDVKHTISGHFPNIQHGLIYEFVGEYRLHPKYGNQFVVSHFAKFEQQTTDGVIGFLATKFSNVGTKTATKIVELYGLDCLEKIKKDNNLLDEIFASNVRKQQFIDELNQLLGDEKTIIFLIELGLTPKIVDQVMKKIPHDTIETIRQNPFVLCYRIHFINYAKALEIALKLGYKKDDDICVVAAFITALVSEAYSNGNLYMSYEALFYDTLKLVGQEDKFDDILSQMLDERQIILEDHKYFLSRFYQLEISIAQRIIKLNNPQKLKYDKDFFASIINKNANILYDDEQLSAIHKSLSRQFSIITGGPGTGKTTIIKGFLKAYAYIKNINILDAKQCESIGIMAPTGRAAKRMSEVLGLKARTIHSALGFDFDEGFAYNEDNRLPYSLIVVDEASMVDVELADALLRAIPDYAHVVIVGDVDQLPSVGPGYFLGDMIDSEVIATTKLEKIYRQDKDSDIINLAQEINHSTLTSDLISTDQVTYCPAYDEQIPDKILQEVRYFIDAGYSLIDDIQILIPTYKGASGINHINTLVQMMFNPNFNKPKRIKHFNEYYYEGDKVIQKVNNKERQVMNGDLGIIKKIMKNSSGEDILIVDFDGIEIEYEKQDLLEIGLAYAISIHKSQGSEYKVVLLPIVKYQTFMLKKELVYTAVTRAIEHIVIFGAKQALANASKRKLDRRKTMLLVRLVSLNHISESLSN